MPLTEFAQRYSISDEPEPGFMIAVREWDLYVGRIRRLADPLENPFGWAQVCGGIAVAMIYATVSLPDKANHPYRYAAHLAAAIDFTVVTGFCLWLGKRQRERRPETVGSIVSDMERHRDAKAPHAATLADQEERLPPAA
jgi:hypothetical protein